jgi:hypothetical protein
MTDPIYASWDPGEVTTGRCFWDDKANPLIMDELVQKDFDEIIENLPTTIQVFIIEQYRPYGHIQHTGNKLLTAQRIGDLKGCARRKGIKVVEQPANILKIASMWSGMELPPGHTPDWMSAFLHGYYYLYNKGLIEPRVLKDGS